MYITYCRNQKTVDLEDKTSYRLSVTGGDYRPTWLIRVPDWEKVPGEAAVDGYHTLSYCWEQSGEVVKRENENEYDLVDNGEHCIVEGYDVYNDYITGSCLSELYEDDVEEVVDPQDIEKNNKYVTWCEPTSETTTLKHVTYEELLQQLCKDFQVEYLWYDKVCINQSDKKRKLEEINQMHKIYRNARYTIALVPELVVYDAEKFNHKNDLYGNFAQSFLMTGFNSTSCWRTRSWTLEELMMSRRILMVGTDMNMFQHSLHTPGAPPTTVDLFSALMLDFGGQIEKKGGSVNQALSEAHFRTSTKPHDMIFALKNIFVHMFDDIKISYSTDVQATFNNFYRHIATKDLSILCFGSSLDPNGEYAQHLSTMGNYNLPSWTGVDGWHIRERVNITTHPQLSYTINNNMKMNIKTNRYWKISIKRYKYGPYGFATEKDTQSKKDIVLEHFQKIDSARFIGNWRDMSRADKDTILVEWCANIHLFTNLYMTHYHYREHENNALTQLRPLSLTEDCEGRECIVLPILLEAQALTHKPVSEHKYVAGPYKFDLLLPVFCKCPNSTSEQYRAVGVYLLGSCSYDDVSPTFNWNHCIGRDDVGPVQNSKDILDILFENNYHDAPKQFIIE